MRKKKINKVCITYPPFEYNTNYPLNDKEDCTGLSDYNNNEFIKDKFLM